VVQLGIIWNALKRYAQHPLAVAVATLPGIELRQANVGGGEQRGSFDVNVENRIGEQRAGQGPDVLRRKRP
jgi:hypothetical protein